MRRPVPARRIPWPSTSRRNLGPARSVYSGMQHRTSAPSTETPAPQGPRTRAELDALVGQRTELRDQLREMGSRRNQIEEQIQSADPARVSQIRGEMKEIDRRATALN